MKVTIEPDHETLVLIAYTSSECSGEQSSQSLHFLHRQRRDIDAYSVQNVGFLILLIAVHARLMNDFSISDKYQNCLKCFKFGFIMYIGLL